MPPTDPTTAPIGTHADRTLRDLLRTDGRLSFERASRILADVADALARMHAAGQAHGAITPQSIRIDASGGAVLGPPVADVSATGLLPPAYLAPERIDGAPADPRSDVYALGLVGWEMLTGQTPWAGESLTEILADQHEEDLPRLTTVRPGVPRPLLLAIEGALHKSPGDRWSTAGEMLATLGAPPAAAPPPVEVKAVAHGPITAHREPVIPARPLVSSHRQARRGRKFAIVALALAVIMASAAAIASFQRRDRQHVTGPWLDSLTTTTSAGAVITDDTLNGSAARLRAQEARRESLATYGTVPSAYPASPAPAYPPPSSYAPYPATPYPATPAPAPTTATPLPAPVVPTDADVQAARDSALARARAESLRQKALADSARRAAVPVESTPTAVPTMPTPPTPTRDTTSPAPARDTTRKPTTDTTRKVPPDSGA